MFSASPAAAEYRHSSRSRRNRPLLCISKNAGQAVGSPVMPNPSLKLTRYGRRRKAGPLHMVHHRAPALRRLPPRAA